VVLHSSSLATKDFSYVNKEISLALDRQRYARNGIRFLIPAQLDDTPLMPDIREFQSTRAVSDQEVAGLISTIKRDFQRRSRG
jgi:hypothetical protein